MLRMAKRKPKPSDEPSAKPTSARAGKTLFVYLDPPLRDALDALLQESRRSLTAEVSLALEAHLQKAGFWPPDRAKQG